VCLQSSNESFEKRPLAAGAGVVDEHVDAAESSGELVDHVRGTGQLREVEPADLSTASARLHLARRLACAVFVLVPGDADVVAERDGGGLADPGVRAGDDRYGHAARISGDARRETSYSFASSSQDSPLTPSQ
jgi:hypothetical protein